MKRQQAKIVQSKVLAPFNRASVNAEKGEQFKEIMGTEVKGVYYISSMGRVYRCPYEMVKEYASGNRAKYVYEGRYIPICSDGRGRKQVYIDGINKLVHILVAEAFLKKPKGFGETKYNVKHKNGDLWNSEASNLKWVDIKQTAKERDIFKLAVIVEGVNEEGKKRLKGESTKRFESMKDCARWAQVSRQAVHKCVHNKWILKSMFRVRAEREGYSRAVKIQEQGGRKYKY